MVHMTETSVNISEVYRNINCQHFILKATSALPDDQRNDLNIIFDMFC